MYGLSFGEGILVTVSSDKVAKVWKIDENEIDRMEENLLMTEKSTIGNTTSFGRGGHR